MSLYFQAMQSSAIESRTQLRLNVEIEEQKQKLADLKITKEQERAKLGKLLVVFVFFLN